MRCFILCKVLIQMLPILSHVEGRSCTAILCLIQHQKENRVRLDSIYFALAFEHFLTFRERTVHEISTQPMADAIHHCGCLLK